MNIPTYRYRFIVFLLLRCSLYLQAGAFSLVFTLFFRGTMPSGYARFKGLFCWSDGDGAKELRDSHLRLSMYYGVLGIVCCGDIT